MILAQLDIAQHLIHPVESFFPQPSVSITNHHWLVVWNIFICPYGNVIIPTDELIFFRGVQTTNLLVVSRWLKPPTRSVWYRLRSVAARRFTGPLVISEWYGRPKKKRCGLADESKSYGM